MTNPSLSRRARRALDAHASLQRAAALTAQAVERALAAHELTASQAGVLDTLAQRGPVHQQELAETLGRSKAQMTAILDTLEKRGAVRRERRLNDRRFVHVELMPAGIALLDAVQPDRVAAVVESLRGLDGKQRRRLAKLTRRLSRSLMPESTSAGSEPAVEALSPVAESTVSTTMSGSPVFEFVHRFRPAASSMAPQLLLLLLHGTGGNEDDLLPLADMIAEGAAVLSPRGTSLDEGVPRFFRRLREGVFDLEDLEAKTQDLARFIAQARAHYGVAELPILAVGFSNGANIASNLLLRYPGLLRGALLLRGMLPPTPTTLPELTGTHVTLANGSYDPIVPRDQPEQLAGLLRTAGATVRLEWLPTGHQLTGTDMQLGRALVQAVLS
jgi:phospholipase/carboxylesterase